jgi:hypothetical protein
MMPTRLFARGNGLAQTAAIVSPGQIPGELGGIAIDHPGPTLVRYLIRHPNTAAAMNKGTGDDEICDPGTRRLQKRA